MEWRKLKGSDAWHFCKNCTAWPTSNYDVVYTKPTSGEFDNQCLAKQRDNNCTS